MKNAKKGDSFSYRPKKEHAGKLNELIAATERPKAFFLDKALEAFMPELEKRYAADLDEYRKKKAAMNDSDESSSTVEIPAERPAGKPISYLKGKFRRKTT